MTPSGSSRTDALLAAITAEIEARRARLDATSAKGNITILFKFQRQDGPADKLAFTYLFAPGDLSFPKKDLR